MNERSLFSLSLQASHLGSARANLKPELLISLQEKYAPTSLPWSQRSGVFFLGSLTSALAM